MALPIINGVTELNSFYSYVHSNSATYQFGSAAEALEAYPNLQAVDGYINSGSVQGNIVEFQPNLTGGTAAGVEAVSASEGVGAVSVTTGAGEIRPQQLRQNYRSSSWRRREKKIPHH